MSLIKRAVDTVYTFRFLRILTMPWTKMEAYKLGLIDEKGKKLKKPQTSQERAAYTLFHRLVFNLKRILNIVPGKTARMLASYASALYLLREKFNLSEEVVLRALNQNLDLNEGIEEEGLIENCVYQINKDIVIPMANESIDIEAISGSLITILKPVGKHFGSTIYEARHHLSDKKIYVSEGDISTNLNQEEFSVSTVDIAMPPAPLKTDFGDKYQKFTVPTSIFQRFDRGRKKRQRWKTFLDLNDEKQYQIAQFAKKYRNALVILQDESTGATRAIRPTSTDGR
jgi:hypothetical protein